jgi:hypothetical protein
MKKSIIMFFASGYLLILCTCSETVHQHHDIRIVKIFELGNEDNENEELFADIMSIAVDRTGYLYVADRQFNTIKKFDQNGKFIKKWGGPGNGPEEFLRLQSILTDSKGNVFGLDMGNNKLVKFNSDGFFIKSIPIRINTYRMRMTPDNKLFLIISDPKRNIIEQYDGDLVFEGRSIIIEKEHTVTAIYDFIVEQPWAICIDNYNGIMEKYDLASSKLVHKHAVDNQEIAAERTRELAGKTNTPARGIGWGALSPFSKEMYVLSGSFRMNRQQEKVSYKRSYLYELDGAYYGQIILEPGPEWYRDIIKYNEYFYTFDQTKVSKYKLHNPDEKTISDLVNAN